MKMFRNMNVGAKINLLIAVCLICLIVTGLIGYRGTSQMNDASASMYNNALLPVQIMGTIQSNTNKAQSDVLGLMLTRDEKVNEALKNEIQDIANKNDQLFAQFLNTKLDSFEKETVTKYNSVISEYRKARQDVINLALQNKNDEAYALYLQKVTPLRDQTNQLLQDLVDYNTKTAGDINQANGQLFASSRNGVIGFIAASLLISLVVGFAIARSISHPLNRVLGLLGKIADGDLRDRLDIDSKDEIGRMAAALNHTVQSLKTTMNGILSAAVNVSAAAEQISASSEEIASSSSSQAGEAQTISELFKELSAAINSVAESAEGASDLSNRTLTMAQEGGKVVGHSIDGMNQINRQMALLEEDSGKIGEIISVIDDIADQTNLLALNAAIEAARAGDQGRGFAVVADEVRKLAERSSEATKQITVIIKGMQENTSLSVKAVGEGTVSSQRTGEAFESITTIVNQTAHKVSEIAAACEQQAAQASEVMKSVETISSGTEEAAAGCQETAATSQTLAQMALELNRAVASFKL